MADLDEAPLLDLQADIDEEDGEDLAQDYRLLSSLTAKSGYKIPKRGEKDFESHGTKQQAGKLEAQRQAMHDVLGYTRVYPPKSHTRAFYYGVESLDRDEVIAEEWRQGIGENHVVVVASQKQSFGKTMGTWTTGKENTTLWLLPEEALFLVERGSLDLWWPSHSSYKHVRKDLKDDDQHEDENENEIYEYEEGGNQTNRDDEDEGTPMSLQAAYAMLIGKDGERGKISLEKFNVYANLKRTGYVVCRAWEWDPKIASLGHVDVHDVNLQKQQSFFNWLFGRYFGTDETKPCAHGPLVRPGIYRSYNSIYRQIAVIPRHKPSQNPDNPSPESPYQVFYHLWRPMVAYTRRSAGPPAFRIAIADARFDAIPTLKQMTSLLETTPWNPPPSHLNEPLKVNQRLKHGWRNVLLAVIDQGVISYMRLGEAAFGEERLSDRFDGGSGHGAKQGGGSRGRGGRGRGRGRARGK